MPEIEIKRTHLGSIENQRYLWGDERADHDPGCVTISQKTVTTTEIRLPDITGEYEIPELGTTIVVDMTGISKDMWDEHKIRLKSDLIGGERVIYLGSQNDTSREKIDKETELKVRVPTVPKPRPNYHGGI